MQKLKSTKFFILFFTIFTGIAFASWLLGPEGFESRVIIRNTSPTTTNWYAPNYHTPFYVYTPGYESDSAVGSGPMSWPAWWGNFIRTPQLNCSTADSTILTFRMWNTGWASDSARFYAWIEPTGYCSTTTVSMATGRDWEEISIDFTRFAAGHTQVFFYLEGNFGNDSHTHEVKFDNIGIRTGTVLGIDESARPSRFDINIYPNPFNSSVRISFDCHSRESGNPAGGVQIEIFDINGKRIFAETVGATHASPASTDKACLVPTEFIWSPAPSVPSGIYLVKAKMGDFEKTKRIIYLR